MESSTEMNNPDLTTVRGTSSNIKAKPQSGTSVKLSDQHMRQYITRSKYELITKPQDNRPDLELPTFSSNGSIKEFLRNLNLLPSKRASISKIVPKITTNQMVRNPSKVPHERLFTTNSDVNSNTQVLDLPNVIDVDDIKVISDAEMTSESDQLEMICQSEHPEMSCGSDQTKLTPTKNTSMMSETVEPNEHLLTPRKYDLMHNYTKNPVIIHFPSAKNTSSSETKSISQSDNSQCSSTTKPYASIRTITPYSIDNIPATVTSKGIRDAGIKPVVSSREIRPLKASETIMSNAGSITPLTPLGKLLITPKSKVKANAFPPLQEVITASKTPGSVLHSILAQLKEMTKNEDSTPLEPVDSSASKDPEKHEHQYVDHTLSPVKVEVVKSVPMHSCLIGSHYTDLNVPPPPIKEEVVYTSDTPSNHQNPDPDAPTIVKIDFNTLSKKTQGLNSNNVSTTIHAETKAMPTSLRYNEKPTLDSVSTIVKFEREVNPTNYYQSVKESSNTTQETLVPLKNELVGTALEDVSHNVDEPTSSAAVLDSSLEIDQAVDFPYLEEGRTTNAENDVTPQNITNTEEKIKNETGKCFVNDISTCRLDHQPTIPGPSSVSESTAHGEDQRLNGTKLPMTAYSEDKIERNLFSVFNLSPSRKKASKNKQQQDVVSVSPPETPHFGGFDGSFMDDTRDDSDQDIWPEDQLQGSPEDIKTAFQTLISEVATLGPNIFVNSKKVFRVPAQNDHDDSDDFTNLKATPEPMLCPICNIPFKFASHILEHVKIHFDVKPYKCHFCPKRFRRKHGGLKKHMLTHQAEKLLRCEICNKGFTQSAYLVQHRSSHTDFKPFKCEICGRAFKKKCHFQAHMACQHSNDKPFVCSICGKCYKLNNHLVQHIKTHSDEKAYSCAHCSKSFHAATSLKRHMKLHTGEKPFECEVCGKAFLERGNWVRHLKRVCKREMEDRKFKCEFCDKRFLQRIHRKVHMRTHTDEIPFWCRLCGKGFKTAGNRKSHYTWHVKKGDIDTVDVLEETDALIEAQNRVLKNANTGMHLPTRPRLCNVIGSSKDPKDGITNKEDVRKDT